MGKIQDGGLFALSLWQPLQCCRFDLSKSTESGGGIGQVNNFFSELEDAIAVLDSNTLTVEEDFQCAKINTLKREGLEVL